MPCSILTHKVSETSFVGEAAVKTFGYIGNNLSLSYNYIWGPLADRIVKLMPEYVAPNTITLAGSPVPPSRLFVRRAWAPAGDDFRLVRAAHFKPRAHCFCLPHVDLSVARQCRREAGEKDKYNCKQHRILIAAGHAL